MICTSIQNLGLEAIVEKLESGELEMAEIRLDLCPGLSDEDIDILFSTTDIPLIATCRVCECDSAAAAERRLRLAIEAGAKFVDIEVEAPAPMGKRLRRSAKQYGVTFIRSWHDFDGTPGSEELEMQVETCRKYGADIVKIATFAHNADDVRRVMDLYGGIEEGRLVAFCMGEEGRDSRLECLKKGAPFTYAALDDDAATAPGQWTSSEMMERLYRGSEDFHLGCVRMPSSKSFAQRAIIAAALAEGVSHLRGYSPCADSQAAIDVARLLGADVSGDEVLTIKGIGPIDAALSLDEVHMGESGLLARLMIPLLALLNGSPVLVNGEKTLLRRPLIGAADIMASFGVVLTNQEPRDGREIHVPLRVNGPLVPGRADISGKGGSQLISGLLMALPLASRPSTIYISDPRSIPYMFITLDVLKKFGVEIVNEMEGGEDFLETRDWSLCTGMSFRIRGGQSYKAADIDLEGDWSSAANFLVAGAVFGSAQLSGLDLASLQADLTIMDVLVEAGGAISQIDTDYVDSVEASATAAGIAPHKDIVNVAKSPLNAFDVDLNNAPDIFPITSVLAAFCPGESRIGGVGRLVGKESNRAEAILEMLLQMGVEARIEGDDMVIRGHSLSYRILNRKLLKGGSYTSRHDHRMVMALKVASLGADSSIVIDDEDCVSKSFPDFLEIFSS